MLAAIIHLSKCFSTFPCLDFYFNLNVNLNVLSLPPIAHSNWGMMKFSYEDTSLYENPPVGTGIFPSKEMEHNGQKVQKLGPNVKLT